MSEELLSVNLGQDDKLVLDSQIGFSTCPDKQLYVVFYAELLTPRYAELFEDIFNDEIPSYHVCQTEYFETLAEAVRAFNIRMNSDSPYNPSRLPQFEFPPHGLGDILADALKRKEEG